MVRFGWKTAAFSGLAALAALIVSRSGPVHPSSVPRRRSNVLLPLPPITHTSRPTGDPRGPVFQIVRSGADERHGEGALSLTARLRCAGAGLGMKGR